MDDGDALLDFPCPRCGTGSHDRFYGPCQTCRDQLVATSAGQGRAADGGRFEPAMHVVPNQIATKE